MDSEILSHAVCSAIAFVWYSTLSTKVAVLKRGAFVIDTLCLGQAPPSACNVLTTNYYSDGDQVMDMCCIYICFVCSLLWAGKALYLSRPSLPPRP